MKSGARRLKRSGVVTRGFRSAKRQEATPGALRRGDFHARGRGRRGNRSDQNDIRRRLLRFPRAVALHGFTGRGMGRVQHAADHGKGSGFAGHAPGQGRERQRQNGHNYDDRLDATHGQKLSTGRTTVCNYSFPQKANVTAPTRNRKEMAWFHLMRSPR
jgi:hypothetical protein